MICGPVFARTNDPVPYVHFESPGAKHAWPNRAACWSPATPAMGSVNPPNASGSVWPMTPVDAVTSGRACGGTPNSSQSSADHCPAVMSRSEEHTSELQSRENLVCRLLLEKKKKNSRNSKSAKYKTKEKH